MVAKPEGTSITAIRRRKRHSASRDVAFWLAISPAVVIAVLWGTSDPHGQLLGHESSWSSNLSTTRRVVAMTEVGNVVSLVIEDKELSYATVQIKAADPLPYSSPAEVIGFLYAPRPGLCGIRVFRFSNTEGGGGVERTDSSTLVEVQFWALEAIALLPAITLELLRWRARRRLIADGSLHGFPVVQDDGQPPGRAAR